MTTNTTGTTIFKNASVLLIAQVITWSLTLLLTVVQPRFLGPSGTGELVVAGAIWGIVAILISFGMDTLLTKEVARGKAELAILLSTSLWVRLVMYLLTGAGVTIYMVLMQFSPFSMLVVHIVGLSIFIWQLIGALQAVLQGLEIMQYISVANIAGKAVNTFAGIGVLVLGGGVIGISVVMVLAGLACFIIEIYYLRQRLALSLAFEPRRFVPMIQASLPYVMAGIVHATYTNINTLALATMMDTRTVGWYGAAGQLFGTLLFVPVALTTAIFPTLARAHTSAPETLPAMLRKSIDTMFLTGMPIGLGLLAVAPQLVLLLFGEAFAPSGAVLQLFGVTLIFMYFNMLFGQYFNSIDRQNVWTACIGVSTVIMLIMTVLLIPWCEQNLGNGAVGGAAGLLAGEAGMAVAGFVLVPRGTLRWSNMWVAVRVLLAGLLMVGVVWALAGAFIAIPVLVGAAVYVSAIMLLRVVPREDLALLKEFGDRVVARVQRGRARPTTP